jgi:hypothetical protein
VDDRGNAAGVAAERTAKFGRSVQKLDVPELQNTLNAQRQVVDFVPGGPEEWSNPAPLGGAGDLVSCLRGELRRSICW